MVARPDVESLSLELLPLGHVAAAKHGLLWCGICYGGLRGRSVSPGHYGFSGRRLRGTWLMGSYVGRRPESVNGGAPSPPGSLGALLDGLPALRDYMTAEAWEDGKKWQTSTVSIFVEGGRLKASLNDRALRRGLYATGDSVEEVLQLLDSAVSGGHAEWRAWPRGK